MNGDQRVVAISADVTSKDDVVRAFDEAKVRVGCDPEYVFLCAGKMVIMIDNGWYTHMHATNRCRLSQAFR